MFELHFLDVFGWDTFFGQLCQLLFTCLCVCLQELNDANVSNPNLAILNDGVLESVSSSKEFVHNNDKGTGTNPLEVVPNDNSVGVTNQQSLVSNNDTDKGIQGSKTSVIEKVACPNELVPGKGIQGSVAKNVANLLEMIITKGFQDQRQRHQRMLLVFKCQMKNHHQTSELYHKRMWLVILEPLA